jgi:hypothetical protein
MARTTFGAALLDRRQQELLREVAILKVTSQPLRSNSHSAVPRSRASR